MITVTVVYALTERTTEIEVRLPEGVTVDDAIAHSRIADRHPGLDFASAPVGIFGRRVQRDRVLADGDRVEIYRPLVADPKTARRKRAGRGR